MTQDDRPNGLNTIEAWPEESREAAKLVLDKYGEPDEATDSQLIGTSAASGSGS